MTFEQYELEIAVMGMLQFGARLGGTKGRALYPRLQF
jgi:hypothetical protein